jgi:hypothetical protein
MELVLTRKYFTDTSTVSELSVNGTFFCHILEDVDRGLTSSMSLDEIKQKKVFAKTCIPYGKYKVINSYSPRFKKYLPLLLNVPGYAGIRIHPGNRHTDTAGCLLPGKYNSKTPNFVGSSVVTFNSLMKLITQAEKKEEIIISITK